MVALAVSAIVIAGTYAGFNLLSGQQQLLNAQTEVDRNTLRVIDLIQSDIRMAGYSDYRYYQSTSAVIPTQAIVISSASDFSVVYDEDMNNRVLIRYFIQSYTSSATGMTRNRLMRDSRVCPQPNLSTGCTVASSSSNSNGQPILDWVQKFSVTGLNQKTNGSSFNGQFQSVSIELWVNVPDKIQGIGKNLANKLTLKKFIFQTTAKNISLVQ
jgi:type II secretory pathway component PulJ